MKRFKKSTPIGLTPYAVLGVGPYAMDATIRRMYHVLITPHHPDVRKDKLPGPEWDALNAAYKAIDTRVHREEWMAGAVLLSGGCRMCKRFGVLPNSVSRCLECKGTGRIM